MIPSLDVIIVSHNTREDLSHCLRSVHTDPPVCLHRVFVVDNASTDGSPDLVRETWPGIRLLALDRNVGFGAANNVALRESDADLVLFLNSDTLVPPGAIETLAARLVASGAVAAGPRLVDGTGRDEVSYGRTLTPWSEAVQAIRQRMAARTDAWSRRRIAALVSRERDVDWVTGACLIARRQAVLDAGLFDERYFLYEEDVDLCAALRAMGGRVIFTPHAKVIHLRGQSTRGRSAAARAIYDRSHLAFYDKHAPHWAGALRLWKKIRGRLGSVK